MTDAALLDRVPLLAPLNAAARRVLAERAAVRAFAPGARLWTRGERPRGLFVILDGTVRVVRAPGGRSFVVHTEGPGGTLGEVPLFAGGGYPAEAEAVGAVRCLVVDRDALAAAVAADPALAFALLERLARRVGGLIERLDGRTALGVRARLAALVLARADGAARPTFTLGATQAAVAEELGTVREVVVRELRRLRESGALAAAGRGRYAVADAARLRALAAGRV